MAGLETLEIVIGLVFVYLLFSILVTLLVEFVSSWFGLRAKNLKKIISRALDDEGGSRMSSEFYKHPLVKYLAQSNKRLPSYIGSDKFAKVVLDIIRTNGSVNTLGQSSSLDNNATISGAINGIGLLDADTKSLLVSFAKEADEDINEFGIRLETWFNETVERGQGWFNRNIKLLTLGISLLVAGLCNVDTIRLYQQLSSNADLRAQIADNAGEFLKNDSLREEFEKRQVTRNDSIPADSSFRIAQERLSKFYSNELKENTNMLAIGWDKEGSTYFKKGCNWILVFLGWIITAFAISLGAPFWFGLLNKLVALRAAGKGSADEEAAKRNKDQVSKPKPVG